MTFMKTVIVLIYFYYRIFNTEESAENLGYFGYVLDAMLGFQVGETLKTLLFPRDTR